MPAAAEADETPSSASDHDQAGNGAADKPKPLRRSRKTQQGLPEGWIIDDEGFVVPGPD